MLSLWTWVASRTHGVLASCLEGSPDGALDLWGPLTSLQNRFGAEQEPWFHHSFLHWPFSSCMLLSTANSEQHAHTFLGSERFIESWGFLTHLGANARFSEGTLCSFLSRLKITPIISSCSLTTILLLCFHFKESLNLGLSEAFKVADERDGVCVRGEITKLCCSLNWSFSTAWLALAGKFLGRNIKGKPQREVHSIFTML